MIALYGTSGPCQPIYRHANVLSESSGIVVVADQADDFEQDFSQFNVLSDLSYSDYNCLSGIETRHQSDAKSW